MTVRRNTRVTDDQPLSIQIVKELASVTGMSILEVEPLQTTIDTEALDTILEGGENVEVSFRHHGYQVTATPDEIVVQDYHEE